MAVLMVLILASSAADARNRKGDKWLKEGQAAELRRDYENALNAYEKALVEDPGDAAYMMAARRVRFQAGMARVGAGRKLRDQGQLEQALAEFQKAYATDPSSSIADQEYRRTKDMIEREKKGPNAPTPEERGLSPAERAQKQIQEKVDRIETLPDLKPIARQISTLKMNNQPIKVLYETVGKLAGINVVFDPELQPPPGGKTTFTVDLSNTTLEQALDYLGVLTRTFWKPLSANTIFVTNENVTKRRDYEDYVAKVFYIKNATTVQELQEISTTVRSITEIRRAFTYNALNAILFRGTADQIALAEKLINDLDKPRSEVVVDIVVMEANRSRVRDLAATLTTAGGNAGIRIPLIYNPGGSTATTGGEGSGSTTTTATPLANLNTIKNIGAGDFSFAVPGGLVQALMSDSQTRVLQQPQVRAIENQKATLHIGDKIPYASGSFQPGIGAVGVSPLVSTQFQFAEVGVKVDLTPKVHGRDEVSLHVEAEVSTVARTVSLGGLDQPVISLKRVTHDIRLRQGEVNLLGGLMSVQNTRTNVGIPGLMHIPFIGRYLFATDHTEKNEGELLIALVPHIVRAPEFTESNLRGVATGSDTVIKLNYVPKDESAQPESPAPAPATAPSPLAPAPKPEAAVPAPTAQARLIFAPATVQAQLSTPVSVTLLAENVTDLFTAPLKIKFDPKMLRLTSVRQGSLLGGDGQKVNFSENTQNDLGEASVTLNRLPGSGGISGSGPLVTLVFQPVARGTTQVSIAEADLKNSQMQPVGAASAMLAINVQ